MRQKILTILFLILLKPFSVLAEAQSIADWENTLEDIWIKQNIISLTTSFNIETKTKILGSVRRKLFSLTPEYHLTDFDGSELAQSRMEFFSLRETFNIYDNSSTLLGRTQRKFSWFVPKFEILSTAGQKQGIATLNFWGTKFTISDPTDDHAIAIISRPFFRLKNDWFIHIEDPQAISRAHIHPQAFLTLLAWQVDYEYWEQQQQQQQKACSLQRASMCQKEVTKTRLDILQEKVEALQPLLEAIEPTEEDFQTIEFLTDQLSSTHHSSLDETAQLKAYVIFFLNLLETDQLTLSQKAALCIMLNQKTSWF